MQDFLIISHKTNDEIPQLTPGHMSHNSMVVTRYATALDMHKKLSSSYGCYNKTTFKYGRDT